MTATLDAIQKAQELESALFDSDDIHVVTVVTLDRLRAAAELAAPVLMSDVLRRAMVIAYAKGRIDEMQRRLKELDGGAAP